MPLVDSYFPTTIPPYAVRLHNGTPVVRGNIQQRLFGNQQQQQQQQQQEAEAPDHAGFVAQAPNADARVPYAAFADRLQCAPSQPDFNQNGLVGQLHLLPPSMAMLEWACAHAETRCYRTDCTVKATLYKFNASFAGSTFGVYNYDGFTATHLFRVLNNSVYYDWPWGRQRIDQYKIAKNNGTHLQPVKMQTEPNHWLLINTLKMLRVADSVFFMGGEQPFLPWLFPFPAFACTGKIGNAEIAWPWPESVKAEHNLYRKLQDRNDYRPATVAELTTQKPWADRVAKAAFYSTHNEMRRLVWDQGACAPPPRTLVHCLSPR